jgi:hypothetical protein
MTSSTLRPARAQAAAMRARTAATPSRIDTTPLDEAAVRAVDGEVGDAVGFLVAGS